MSILGWMLGLAGSLAVLVWGAGIFVSAAQRIGVRMGLSPFIIGVTVVAIGTSLPELVAGVASVLEGAPEIALGTAIGSNVTNILLILGVVAAIGGGITVDYELVRVDLPFLFGSALMLWFFGQDGTVTAIEGVLSLVALSIYIAYAASSGDDPATTVGRSASELAPVPAAGPGGSLARICGALLLSAAVTQVGAHFTVVSILELSEIAKVGTEMIATSVVALGTSLPELVVSVRAARAGQPEIAVGNVVGSNIFNVLGVVGVSALFGDLVMPASLAEFAMPAMLGVTVLGFFVLQEREVTRWDAPLLVVLYLGFLLQLGWEG